MWRWRGDLAALLLRTDMAAAGASQFTFHLETTGIDMDCDKAIALANSVRQVRRVRPHPAAGAGQQQAGMHGLVASCRLGLAAKCSGARKTTGAACSARLQ